MHQLSCALAIRFSIWFEFDSYKCNADLWNKDSRYCWCWPIYSWSYKVWKLQCWSCRSCFWLFGTIGGGKQKSCIFRIFFMTINPVWIPLIVWDFVQNVFDFQLIKSLLQLEFRYIHLPCTKDFYGIWVCFLSGYRFITSNLLVTGNHFLFIHAMLECKILNRVVEGNFMILRYFLMTGTFQVSIWRNACCYWCLCKTHLCG